MKPISVIIPTYNRAHTLPRSLGSLLKQTLSRSQFDVIIVDDGSTDDTEAVLATYEGVLPLTVINQRHAGVSAARNAGIQASDSEIIVFFDDDARAEPDWLELILKIMQQEDIITGRVEPLCENIWPYFAPHYNQGNEPHVSSVLLEGNCAIKRRVFDEVGMFDATIDYGHEGESFLQKVGTKYVNRYYPTVIIYHDYAVSLKHYLRKQKKFGEQLWYVKDLKARTLSDFFECYKKAQRPGTGTNNAAKPRPTLFIQKLQIAVYARLGSLMHLWGAFGGWRKQLNSART